MGIIGIIVLLLFIAYFYVRVTDLKRGSDKKTNEAIKDTLKQC